MPKNNEARLVRTSKYFELPNKGLESYFDIVRVGQPDVYRTTFAGKDKSVSSVLDEWMPILEAISDEWPSLWEFENDLAGKVGPMSVMFPLKERMSDIEHYYEDILLSSKPISENAIACVIGDWAKVKGLRLRSRKRTMELMKKSTNSGNPYFTKRRLVNEQTIQSELDERGDYVYMDTPNGIFPVVAMLGWRGQEGGPKPSDVKQRVVWMFPYEVNLEELRVYQPLIESAQKMNLVPAWVSMDQVDKEITELFDSKGSDDLIVCTDFSRFDQHFNPHMSDAAYKILNSILTPSAETSWWLNEVFPVKYYINMVTPTKLFKGKHGMGSGSGGTNADETLTHKALQYEAALEHGAKLNPHSMCLGDDGILSYPGITVDDVVDSYSQHGQEMNSDKQSASTQECTYLRRWHHNNYRIDGVCAGVYSTCRALGRLRYMERFQDPTYWDSNAVALRQLSIIENVKYHPLKEEFVDFCMKRDKYRLGIDIPNFLKDIRSIAEEKIENMPDFLGYTKTLQSGGDPTGGIENWWIVKYLRSLK
nr:MAG: RNA-dependent RNA-polymerase [Picobirnavirus sp.]